MARSSSEGGGDGDYEYIILRGGDRFDIPEGRGQARVDPILRSSPSGHQGVDITLAMFHSAVEATIEVDISQVRGNGFSLQLSSSVSGLEKEIQLFRGIVSQSCGLRRFVVAVVRDTWMHLNFKFGFVDDEVERCASFNAKKHGYASEQLKLDEASVTVKVTWSTW
nr:unnamed protein product [Digitaria exilis]